MSRFLSWIKSQLKLCLTVVRCQISQIKEFHVSINSLVTKIHFYCNVVLGLLVIVYGVWWRFWLYCSGGRPFQEEGTFDLPGRYIFYPTIEREVICLFFLTVLFAIRNILWQTQLLMFPPDRSWFCIILYSHFLFPELIASIFCLHFLFYHGTILEPICGFCSSFIFI